MAIGLANCVYSLGGQSNFFLFASVLLVCFEPEEGPPKPDPVTPSDMVDCTYSKERKQPPMN
jgi:hypothetical protein